MSINKSREFCFHSFSFWNLLNVAIALAVDYGTPDGNLQGFPRVALNSVGLLSPLMRGLSWGEDESSRDDVAWSPREVPFHHDRPMIEKGWINKRYECEDCGFVILA